AEVAREPSCYRPDPPARARMLPAVAHESREQPQGQRRHTPTHDPPRHIRTVKFSLKRDAGTQLVRFVTLGSIVGTVATGGRYFGRGGLRRAVVGGTRPFSRR